MGMVPMDSLCSKVSISMLISWKNEDFFREITTKIGGKSQKWLRDPNLQLQKSSYKKKKIKKNSV